jgi:hypothetical protein
VLLKQIAEQEMFRIHIIIIETRGRSAKIVKYDKQKVTLPTLISPSAVKIFDQ